MPALPWAHLAHSCFKSRLQNFSRILAVYPRVTAYLLGQQGCSTPCSEMVQALPQLSALLLILWLSAQGEHRLGFLRTGNELLCPCCYKQVLEEFALLLH